METTRFARIAKALSDPTRFEILECVARKREVPCKGVCECFPVSQATVSHHLKELATAGIVFTRREGQFVYYRVRPGVLDEYLAELERRLQVIRSFTSPAQLFDAFEHDAEADDAEADDVVAVQG